MRTKDDTVDIDNLLSPIKDVLPRLDDLHKEYTGKELVITSGAEATAKHKPDSLHYVGLAVDIRHWYIKRLPEDERQDFAKELREICPYGLYDIVNESTHIHIEFDPKIKKIATIQPKTPEHQADIVPEYKVMALQAPEFNKPFLLFYNIAGSPTFKKTIKIGKIAVNVAGRYYGGITIFEDKKQNRFIQMIQEFLELLTTILKKLLRKF